MGRGVAASVIVMFAQAYPLLLTGAAGRLACTLLLPVARKEGRRLEAGRQAGSQAGRQAGRQVDVHTCIPLPDLTCQQRDGKGEDEPAVMGESARGPGGKRHGRALGSAAAAPAAAAALATLAAGAAGPALAGAALALTLCRNEARLAEEDEESRRRRE